MRPTAKPPFFEPEDELAEFNLGGNQWLCYLGKNIWTWGRVEEVS